MGNELAGRRFAFLVAPEGTEQVELTTPWKAVTRAGGEAVLVSLKPGQVHLFHHLDRGDTWPVDRVLADVSAADFHGLVLPGGVANPDQLRADPGAVGFVRSFVDDGRPVAVICHGPWTLVEADRVRGRTLTSWPSLRTDIRNAGGTWIDEEVTVCTAGPNTIVSSRRPDDLPAFCATMVERFAAAPARAGT